MKVKIIIIALIFMALACRKDTNYIPKPKYSHLQELIRFDNKLQREKTLIENHILKRNPSLMYLADTLYSLSVKYNIPVKLLLSQIDVETIWTWNPKIVSPAGAVGLMQIMPYTGQFISAELNLPYKKELLNNPEYNLTLGVYYLSKLINYYSNFKEALAHYNGGPQNARRFALNSPLLASETKNYINKIYKNL